MAGNTDTARIVNWINKTMPKKVKVHDFFDTVRERVEEVIVNNLSQKARPISFYSVQTIFYYYREQVYEKLRDKFPEPALRTIDEMVRQELDEIYRKYYMEGGST